MTQIREEVSLTKVCNHHLIPADTVSTAIFGVQNSRRRRRSPAGRVMRCPYIGGAASVPRDKVPLRYESSTVDVVCRDRCSSFALLRPPMARPPDSTTSPPPILTSCARQLLAMSVGSKE